MVFDASAKFGGASLNDHLLTGPDLTNSIVGVLCRFRSDKVAVMCDVEQMFFQFRVASEHQKYLNFLWFENDDVQSGKVICYRMQSHIFGASSSPSVCNFCLKRVAKDFGHLFDPRAAAFVDKCFYVDDGLLSLPTDNDAIKVISETRNLLQKASLNLHKFVSNSESVVKQLISDKQSKKVDLPGSAVVERALGIQWDVSADAFVFQISLQEKPKTRRGVLSVTSSVFDPLGIISPYILEGKVIMQAICKSGCGWDEPIPEGLLDRFNAWVDSLKYLQTLSIPRCVKADGFSIKQAELHVFADASNSGYGACAYLRLLSESGAIQCTLVAAKSRVLPSKALSIPRLELSAAVVGVKLGFMLKNELSHVYQNLQVFHWSDSLVTLGYILNDAKKFHTFVCNRVQVIQDLSPKSSWHYVNTVSNPADMASRGLHPKDHKKHSTWFSGPEFLYELSLDKYLTVRFNSLVSASDPEVKSVVLKTKAVELFDLNRFAHCSSWNKVVLALLGSIKFLMLVLKQKQFCTSLRESITLQEVGKVQNFETCKLLMCSLVQKQYFKEELKSLLAEEPVKHCSQLYKLSPFLDRHGLIRVGGRLRCAESDFKSKYPIILPSAKVCYISKLVVTHYHVLCGHQGRAATLSSMRTHGMWVLGSTSNVNAVVQECFQCKKLFGQTQEQVMADLPTARVTPAPPFTYVGVDLFGPFLVKEGRKHVKRYGVIFICMSSRAVHLEVTCSLSTDAFISTLRRFIALRGSVRTLFCDRGTNFIGAEAELKAAVQELSKEEISEFLRKNSCDYVHFQVHVPHASHFGGSWERLIRSARRILVALLQAQGTQLEDECLRTLMYEVAALLNSRPLTLNPTDHDLAFPLCPQNLLTAKSGVVLPPPGKFEEADIYLRKHWRRVQFLCNQFWSKWRKSYISDLQSRQKWNKAHRNLQVGDLVLLKDDLAPRGAWSVCRVEHLYTSSDDKVRSVKVRVGDRSLTKEGKRVKAISFLDRPIHKLVLLLPVEKQ